MVVVFHSKLAMSPADRELLWTWPGLTDFGDTGVSLFFVISGFIIANSVSRPRFSVCDFVWRRFMRLYPLYWMVMLVGLYAYNARNWFSSDVESLGAAGMIKSFLIFPQKQFPFWNPGWSLEHELIFYAIAALIGPIFGLRVLALVMVSLWLVGYNLTFEWDYHLFADPQIYFGAGVLAYILRDRGWAISFPVAVALLGFAYLCYYRVLPYSYTHAGVAFAFGCAALIVMLADLEQRWRVPRFVVTIGDASYSLYLWHWLVIPIAATGRGHLDGSPEVWRWIIVAASIAAALASYFTIERWTVKASRWERSRLLQPEYRRQEKCTKRTGRHG
ncbi:exopolysaccharide production protein ExoZ [Bradyrhizobium sp. LB7.1]